MRSILLLLAFFLALPAHATEPLRVETRLVVSYSETADLFSTMDNVALWWEGFNDPSWRAEWERRFGWSAADQEWAERYAEYRHRTYSDPSQQMDLATSPHGLFASSETNAEGSDPLARYMLSQGSIEAALGGLDAFAGADDAMMLRGFYRHFQPRWRTLLAESAPLGEIARQLQADLGVEGIDDFIGRLEYFYRASAGGEFRIFITRFPAGPGSMAEVVEGQNLMLHMPVDMPYADGDWGTIVMHELVHYISSRQPAEQKRRLSDRFLKLCPVPEGAGRLWMLEEPLAVALGQAAYSQLVLGEPLDPRTNWYAVPWIDVTARTLAGSAITSLEKRERIEQSSIVSQAALRCLDLTAVAKQLAPAG